MSLVPDWCACHKATRDVWATAATLTIVMNSVPAFTYLRDSSTANVEVIAVGGVLLLLFGLLYSSIKGSATVSAPSPDSAACYQASKDVCVFAIAMTTALNAIPAYYSLRDWKAGASLSVEPLVVGAVLVPLLAILYATNKRAAAPLSISAPRTRAERIAALANLDSEWSPTSVLFEAEAPPKIDKLPAAFTRRHKSPVR